MGCKTDNMSGSAPEIILFGSGRLKLISGPLNDTYNVTLQRDLTAEKRTKITKLNSIRNRIRETGAPIIVDSLGLSMLIISKMASRYGNTVYLRPRGGFWGEFKDRKGGVNGFREIIQLKKKRDVRDRVVAEADHILPVSHFLKTQIKHTYPGLETPMDVVYTPYDVDAVATDETNESLRDDWGVGEDSLLLLSVTEFNYRSKVDGVIEFSSALNEILATHEAAHYVVAGSGKYHEWMKQRFRKRLSDDVQDRVVFPGFVSPIAPAYAAADVFLHLSYRDSLAKTVVEAQRSGLPVVVNTGGGMPEVVNPNANGNAVVRTNVDLLSYLKGTVKDGATRSKTGEKNKDWAKTNFQASSIADDFQSVLS